jgi:hypothetical protein
VRRERGAVVVAQELQFLFAVVEDLEEEHPAELFEPLGVAVGAGVLAHDVLDGLTRLETFGMDQAAFWYRAVSSWRTAAR